MKLQTGLSYGYGQNKILISDDNVVNNERTFHYKLKLTNYLTNRIKINFGGEYLHTNFEELYKPFNATSFQTNYSDNQKAAYAEAEIFFSKKS